MKKTRLRFITIAALTFVLALVMCFAFGALGTRASVFAQDYRPTEIFSEGQGGKVGTDKPETADENADYYVQFTFDEEDGEIYFRRDLALKWFVAAADAESALANPGAEKFYTMTFAFPEFNFERFSISYESAEENVSKDGKSTNTLVFFQEGGKLSVAVRNASEQPSEKVQDGTEEDAWFESCAKRELTVGAGDDIVLSLDAEGCGSGEFNVNLNGEAVGRFTNIGGYYMEYLSSASSTPRDPITFAIDGFEGEAAEQHLLMKELNGQSFKINSAGKVDDNADPVLVINEAIYAYTLGRRWSLTYEAIDVCDSSVSITRRYAMVNAATEGDEYPKPLKDDYKALTTSTVFMPTSDDQSTEQYVSIYFELDDGTSHLRKCSKCGNLYDDNTEEKPFAALASSGDNAWTCPGTTEDGTPCDGKKSDYTVESSYIYLTWYTANEKQIKTLSSSAVYECPTCGKQYNKAEYDKEDFTKCTNTDDAKHKNGEETVDTPKDQFKTVEVDPFDYIIVNRGDVSVNSGEKSGPYYVGITADKETLQNTTSDEAAVLAEQYQQAINEIVYKKDDNGNFTRELKLSAGDGAYFYLPSLRGLIQSDNADYRNLRFSVYYKKQSLEVGASASSVTSLRYNALRFEIDEEGKYIFKVLASDAAGNAMKYYFENKLVTVSSTNIWDIEEIPTFEFEVTYTGATVKDLTDNFQGYRDSSYTVTSFDIVALSGYKTEYTLYRFDSSKRRDDQADIDYTEFIENLRKNVETYENCLVEIKTFNSEISEDDERWDRTDNKYHWNPSSSLSFTPQEANTFYVVKLEVTEESRLPGYSVNAYQAIDVRNPLDSRPDPTYWLENNVTSVVLFSISGVLLIAIIVLFIVKPSDKKLEEVDVNTLRGGKKSKKEKDKTEKTE